ncbi:MAG: DegT/DnrJ/EryC1/StrS family aminotransferase [Candidatus Sumerlaeia bacterium]|nr:DegT/DnrJ/EryC1/StrS family aminotransferase [Candidatus Sumerlaeia bacterium]
MAVPFIDLKRFEPDFLPRWFQKVEEVTRNTAFVGGPYVVSLEKRLAEWTGAHACVACANGTDALQLGLRALGVGDVDLVLIPDATFWATFEAVVNVGARPVTVDIDMTDLQMDFSLFQEAVRKYRPKAAILVHLYGWGSAHVEEFRNFCKQEGVHLLEDGAQAWDVKRHGESLYKNSLISTVSFYPAKVLGACGDAGAVFCSTPQLTDAVRLLGNHGRTSHYEHGAMGWNSRMTGFDAAWLELSLDYITARVQSRVNSAKTYYELLEPRGIQLVKPPLGYEETGYLNVTLHTPEKREIIGAHLKANGIGFGTVYPGAMSKQPGAKGYLHAHVGGNNADLLGRGIINLPLFAYMKPEELEEVVRVFLEGVQKAG